jgi:hypothetical protein
MDIVYFPFTGVSDEIMKITFRKVCFALLLAVVFGAPCTVLSEVLSEEFAASPEEATLVKAVMCESLQKLVPANEAVVFSIDLGRVYSFTEFDPVPEQTVIFHKWYRKGSLISVKKLTINPPRWSSLSSMQLRYADKGPWHVDVIDHNDKLLKTLRFSITD